MRSRFNRHLAHEFDETYLARRQAEADRLRGVSKPGRQRTVRPSSPTTPPRRPANRRISHSRTPFPPDEFSWRDYAVFLLHVAAEIEHSLMVQYLFAGYSLGGTDAAKRYQHKVRQWQETILGIAKEEMGHLLTVQNVLMLFGAPLSLDRQDYPWDSEFYPFTFHLQRLTLNSLAAYVCAESPSSWNTTDREEIKTRATIAAGTEVNGVGRLYKKLEEIIGDPARIPDSAFQPSTINRQATQDEWARGHVRGVAGEQTGNVRGVKEAEILISRCGSRDAAVQALREIGEQGEAVAHIPKRVTGPDLSIQREESHFHRFLRTYRAMKTLGDAADKVSRWVADNPRTRHIHDIAMNKTHGGQPFTWSRHGLAGTKPPANVITHREARAWAHLFNLRYRMLLVDLAHALQHPGGSADGESSTRGYLINRTFSEMYNLRAISGRLVQLPLLITSRPGPGPRSEFSGPPFEMPYTLTIPDSEPDRWRLHRDLFNASRFATQRIKAELRGTGLFVDQSRAFLGALEDSDKRTLEHVEAWISSVPASRMSSVSS